MSTTVLLVLLSAHAAAEARSGSGVVGYETIQGLEPGAQMGFSASISRYGADQDPTYGTALYTDTGPDSSLDMVAGALHFHCPGVFVTAQNDVPDLGDLIVLGGNSCEMTGGAEAADLRVWVLFGDPAGGALQGDPEVRATLPVSLAQFPTSSIQVRGCFEPGCDGYDFIITGSLSSFGPIVVPEPAGAGVVALLALGLLRRRRS
jgi:MYXO-CTERM domain-containing protein